MKIQKIMSTNLSKTARNTVIGSMVALSTLAAGTTLQAKNMNIFFLHIKMIEFNICLQN